MLESTAAASMSLSAPETEPPMRLLVVEDFLKVAQFLRDRFTAAGDTVELAQDGEQAVRAAQRGRFDAIVLDLVLPKKSGLEVTSELRQSGSETPILMLTGLDTSEDVVRGLELGADDYLTKPFDFAELRARLRALRRRNRTTVLALGELRLDRLARRARAGHRELDLTVREYRLFEYLMQRPAQDLTRAELLAGVWDIAFDPQTNVVDVYVGTLRRKLRAAGCRGYLRTVRGTGYRLDVPLTS